MFKSTLKITIRNLRRHKGYSFINIAGLAIGMACCIFILLWIQDELSYDKFHKNAKQIYRIVYEDHTTDHTVHRWRTSPALAPALKKAFPGIIRTTRFSEWGTYLVKYGERYANERGGFADPSILKMFTFHFIEGDPETALTDPSSVVITEAMARKYFGNNDPLNQTLNFDNRLDRTVTGVIKNNPHNSELQFDFLIQFETLHEFIDSRNFYDDWDVLGFGTYVLLPEDADIHEFNQKIAGFHEQHEPSIRIRLYAQPLTEIHLHALSGGGPITYVYVFSLIAVFVLLIGCINFMNLSTARSAKRAKEVGLRKIVGANKKTLIQQLFGESVFLSCIGLLFAVVLVELFLPAFNTLSGKHLVLNIFHDGMILGLIIIAAFTGLISGCYPAFFLSSFHPAKVLKEAAKSGSSVFRKILVVVQFSLSIILIICTIVISNQLDYIKNKNVGFNKNNLIFIPNNSELAGKYEAVKGEILQNPGVSNVTRTSVRVGTGTIQETPNVDWEGKEENKKIEFHVVSVDYDFIETFQMEIVQGRHFSEALGTDGQNFIINEEAVRRMGMENPVGKRLSGFDREGIIVGVVKDFHLQSLHTEIEPMILKFAEYWYSYIVVRIKSDHIPSTMTHLKSVSQKFAPSFPFEYHFLDEAFNTLYRSEQRMGQIFKYFAILAICISCLGLFALASFTAEQRTKEIGIRKVLGLSVSGIVLLLSRDFTKWVLLANLIAWPIAYFAMKGWLQDFAYRTNIDIWTFVVSAFLAQIIALITVSYQAIKAAMTNPADTLKYE